MATVSQEIGVSPSTVFGVLSEGWLYSNWVVGTSHMRAVEASWPAVGSRLHHCSGIWPVVTRDETVVEECEENVRLVLLAKGGILGRARVALDLEPAAGGATRVTITEEPVAGIGKWVHNPATEALLARRNVETLARLGAVAERRTQPAD
jgi:hypothetical protein